MSALLGLCSAHLRELRRTVQPTVHLSNSKWLNPFGINHFTSRVKPCVLEKLQPVQSVTIQKKAYDQNFHVVLFTTLVISLCMKQKANAKYFDLVLLYFVGTRGSEKVKNVSRRSSVNPRRYIRKVLVVQARLRPLRRRYPSERKLKQAPNKWLVHDVLHNS